MSVDRKTRRIMILAAVILIIDICIFGIFLSSSREEASAERADASGIANVSMETVPDFPIDENLILVNKTHALDADYEPADMVMLKDRASDRNSAYQKMRPEAAAAFNDLTAAAKQNGHTIVVTTAYRPYSFQESLYNNYLRTKGAEWTEEYSAEPGMSEHQTGLAADVSSPSVDYELDTGYGKTAEGKWLAGHAHEYGFILRYQKGKENITGYAYEPWHIRYVGKDAAEEIYKKNLTLEEYLGAI